MNIADFSLMLLLHEIDSRARGTAQTKGIYFSHKFQGRLPQAVACDSERLRRLVQLLLEASIARTAQGFVELSVWHREDSLGFAIRDTGRVQSPRELDEAQNLCDLLGAELLQKFASEEQGNLWELTVPAPQVVGDFTAPMIQLDALKKETAAGARLANQNILIVEDSADFRFMISKFLSAAGANVIGVENGQEAMEIALRKPFDIILMDVEMPGTDGLTITRRLRERGYTRPIAALSAHSMSEDYQKSMDAGCDDHLTKPITRQSLIATVGKHVNR